MPLTPVGILLAAGRGRRFDASGDTNKLLQTLPNGAIVAEASARTLLSVLPRVIAVVRQEGELAQRLRALGCEVGICADADAGMARSLVHGVTMAASAHGWLVALADMPYVRATTVLALADCIRQGADIALPVHAGQRGNPVAFSAHHRAALLALDGDRGARSIVQSQPVQEVEVDDAGIFADIDTPASLTLEPNSSLPKQP